MQTFLNDCRALVGNQYVLTEENEISPFLTDWRKRYVGKALAVIKPASTEQVAGVVRLCNIYQIPIVPQGGNTGLVLGSVPDSSGQAIILSLTRLNRIRETDPTNNTMTVEAGCILDTVHNAANEVNRLFPLSLASSGTCTIGGNLSSNAGGTAVLHYGNARELCLGLEVVTPQGEIWDGLRGLRKDNTGYDLRDLFIGAEGTLGIITAAVLKLFPRPRAKITAFAAMRTIQDASCLLTIAQKHCMSTLTAFELISQYSLQLVIKHFPHLTLPLPLTHAQYVLLELSDSESEEHAMNQLEVMLESTINDDVIQDAAIAQSIAQSASMWHCRENISAAQALEGKNIKHDIAVPISYVARFIEETDQLLQGRFPGCRMVTFGHLGDGSLHYNVSAPETMTDQQFLVHQEAINRIVYDNVHHFRGAISAEHGLGTLKRDDNLRYKSDVEIRLMQQIKDALDPLRLMNTGKILP